MKKIDDGIYRTLVLTILAGISILLMAFANRDVYSKEVIDAKFRRTEDRDAGITQRLDHIQSDVEWLVRRQGGIPSAQAREDSDTP